MVPAQIRLILIPDGLGIKTCLCPEQWQLTRISDQNSGRWCLPSPLADADIIVARPARDAALIRESNGDLILDRDMGRGVSAHNQATLLRAAL
jgi:hypothetical protein